EKRSRHGQIPRSPVLFPEIRKVLFALPALLSTPSDNCEDSAFLPLNRISPFPLLSEFSHAFFRILIRLPSETKGSRIPAPSVRRLNGHLQNISRFLLSGSCYPAALPLPESIQVFPEIPVCLPSVFLLFFFVPVSVFILIQSPSDIRPVSVPARYPLLCRRKQNFLSALYNMVPHG